MVVRVADAREKAQRHRNRNENDIASKSIVGALPLVLQRLSPPRSALVDCNSNAWIVRIYLRVGVRHNKLPMRLRTVLVLIW